MITGEALVLAQPSVSDFLTEVKKVQDEFEAIRPGKLQIFARRSWRQARNQRMVLIAKKYVKIDDNEKIPFINTEIVEEAKDGLIRASCVEKLKNDKQKLEDKLRVEITVYKIFSFNKDIHDRISLSFVARSENELRITEKFIFDQNHLCISINLPNDQPILFTGIRYDSGSRWLKNVKLHVHSEDEADFLFK